MTEEQLVLVAIQEVPHLYWDANKAKRLRTLLVDETRQSVAEKLNEMGIEVSRQNIDRLFTGQAKWANTQHIIGICKAFSLKLTDFFPIYTISLPSKMQNTLDKSNSNLQE
ncbi:hypothetical protein [Nostoc sp.]